MSGQSKYYMCSKMGDDDRFQDYSSLEEYNMRKKKGKRKRKPNPNLKMNPEEPKDAEEPKDLESDDSNVDAGPRENGFEDQDSTTKEGISLDGMQQMSELRWMRSESGEYSSSLPPENKEEEILEKSVELEEVEELHFQGNLEYNELALSRFAATYELEKYKKHALIIFNQEDIDDKPRHGTISDVEALTSTFEKFGFEVKDNVHHDLTKEKIFQKLDEFMKRDYTEYGCVGVVVLTHGSRYGRLRAHDIQYSEVEIINHFKVHNKPTLVTKPKFLIIQACRGSKIKPPVPVFQSARIRTDTDVDLEPYHLPEEADMLILHSCYVGTPSLRHEVDGSWFIQTLCQKIDQFAATHDLESIITEVKRVVAIDRFHLERETLRLQICQMPVLTSTLIRKLYLKKFGDKPAPDTGLVLPISGLELLPPTRKDSQMLEPGTPLLSQLSCSCFLDHFSYMRTCLKHFVEDNPDDETARLHLDLANEFDDKPDHNNAKQKMLRIIHDYLKNKAKEFEYYKYLYLYNK